MRGPQEHVRVPHGWERRLCGRRRQRRPVFRFWVDGGRCPRREAAYPGRAPLPKWADAAQGWGLHAHGGSTACCGVMALAARLLRALRAQHAHCSYAGALLVWRFDSAIRAVLRLGLLAAAGGLVPGGGVTKARGAALATGCAPSEACVAVIKGENGSSGQEKLWHVATRGVLHMHTPARRERLRSCMASSAATAM